MGSSVMLKKLNCEPAPDTCLNLLVNFYWMLQAHNLVMYLWQLLFVLLLQSLTLGNNLNSEIQLAALKGIPQVDFH